MPERFFVVADIFISLAKRKVHLGALLCKWQRKTKLGFHHSRVGFGKIDLFLCWQETTRPIQARARVQPPCGMRRLPLAYVRQGYAACRPACTRARGNRDTLPSAADNKQR